MVHPVWQMRNGVESDVEALSGLRKEFQDASIRRSCEHDYYRWKLFANPFGRAYVVITEIEGRIIGMTSLTPKPLCIFGQKIAGAELGDVFVKPEFQGCGIASSLLRELTRQALADGIQIIYGAPNRAALPIEKRVGYKLASGAGLVNLVLPIDLAAVLRERLRLRFLSQILGRIGSAYFRLRSRRAKERCCDVSCGEPLSLEAVPLWEAAAQFYDFAIDRSEMYVSWRFQSNPDRGEYRVFAAGRDSRLQGFALAKVGKWGNLSVAYIADYLTSLHEPAIWRDLLSEMVYRFTLEGVHLVSCWVTASDPYYSVLRSLGFLRYASVPIIAVGPLASQRTLATARWHFALADSDNI